MKIPLSWLKEYVDVAVEPEKLGDDLTAAGLAIEGLERHAGETVLDFDVTTNRVDCMNVYGMAREVALVYGLPLKPLALDGPESGAQAERALKVEIEARDLCPRFCARVLDVRMGESPQWLKDRLALVGERPISNVVDLSNYVMLEMGQATHAFDLARIPESRLQVRWAREGEELVTLDGQKRVLQRSMGVVAAPSEALALAGVMGGQSSEVRDETQVVALEAACWEPLSIRRTARRLGMHTEASHRFERGSDFGAPPVATARFAHLLGRIGGGSVRPGLIDVVARKLERPALALRPARVEALLGAHVPAADIGRILAGLGFEVSGVSTGVLRVQVPGWRNDVSREIDLVEEVARHVGLPRFPSSVPPATAPGFLTHRQRRERLVRETLTACGFDEAVNYAFVAAGGEPPPDTQIVRLQNPLSEDQNVLRSALVQPGLLKNLQTNLRQGRRDVRLFEIGRVFAPAPQPGGKPLERLRLGLLASGAWRTHWSEGQRAADLYDLTGTLEALFARLGLEPPRLPGSGEWPAEQPADVHPQRRSLVFANGIPGCVGYVAQAGPALARRFELPAETLIAELELEPLLDARPAGVKVRPLPRFPAVDRDLSLLCGAEVSASAITQCIQKAAGPLLRSAGVADRYEDARKLGPGKFSLTVGLRYQHGERTLTNEEVQQSLAQVIAALQALGVEIRGV